MMNRQYELGISGGDCHDERREYIFSARLPDSPGWTAHVFRCEECRSEFVFYTTVVDPREWAKSRPEEIDWPCKYCHQPVARDDPDGSYDPIACTAVHAACLPAKGRGGWHCSRCHRESAILVYGMCGDCADEARRQGR